MELDLRKWQHDVAGFRKRKIWVGDETPNENELVESHNALIDVYQSLEKLYQEQEQHNRELKELNLKKAEIMDLMKKDILLEKKKLKAAVELLAPHVINHCTLCDSDPASCQKWRKPNSNHYNCDGCATEQVQRMIEQRMKEEANEISY